MEETRAVIPMRPLTFGELLDAAVSLLRAQSRLLFAAAFVLAAAEQALLHPLRRWAGMPPPVYRLDSDHIGGSWLVFCLSTALEAGILALLGGFAGAAAGPGLLGRRVRGRDLLRQVLRRALPLLVIALVSTALVLAASLPLMLPWPLLYGLLGLAAPALIVDRVGPLRAIGRSFKLAGRGMRGAFIRVGAYVGWAAIRMALGYGGATLLGFWTSRHTTSYTVAMIAVWVLVDTVAYAMLACVDGVLYLEVRMRVEGLDVAIGRLRRLDRPIDLAGSVILGSAVR